MDNGYWVKFEAWKVEVSASVPHGVRYSLTLHDKNNHRVIGYDNAHNFKSKQNYGPKKESYDHVHKQMNIVQYEFISASQIMEDFWNSANIIWRTIYENNKSWHHVKRRLQAKNYKYSKRLVYT